MDKPRPCGCKGCRTCLICETNFGAREKQFEKFLDKKKSFIFCPQCNAAWSGWEVAIVLSEHPNHRGTSFSYPGVYIQLDFLNPDEEKNLMKCIDEMPWNVSQSGRRKQNFGPKTNFKKKKLSPGSFLGFPEFSRFIQDRFDSVPLLKHYQTIEQCSLEYTEEKGASIDPHIDDCWIWGERIVTVNCLSDSVLTMTPYRGDVKKYNLIEAQTYSPDVNNYGSLDIGYSDKNLSVYEACLPSELPDIIVRIPMPRYSLLVIYGEARYHWEHAVLRSDIHGRRVCIAYREFTPPYLQHGAHYEKGEVILNKSKHFWNHKEVYKNFVMAEAGSVVKN